MSLLLDALKRAEQEKQLSRGAASEREPVITPMAANAPSALELQPLGGPAQHAASSRSEAAAHAAQAVFQAKQAQIDDSKGRGVIWVTIGIIVIVVAAAGAYVWNQIRVLSPSARPASLTPRPPPAPLAQPASQLPHFEPLAPRAEAAAAAALEPAPAAAPKPAARTDSLVTQLLEERASAPASAPVPPVRLARSAPPPRLSPEVSSGYSALRAGDLEGARRHYQSALAAEPRNLDTLLGMATVEARSGNRPAAAVHYRRALEIDPRNATALASLAALSDATPTEALESQLVQDAVRSPRNAALHLALGNLYSAQGRWNDAQSAYFEAYRLEPAAPDILYNLAVALDHLGKSRLAAGFYRQALEASRGQAAQFDATAAARRAGELEAGGTR